MILEMFPTNSRVNALSRGWAVCQASEKTDRNENDSEDVRKIERSIAYMTQHLNQPVRVAELAAQANVSCSHYFALFKRQTGRAPIDYFIGLRMQRARALLDSTTASVKEIAVDLGYKDPFYFSRVFKSVNLAAPTRYRARQNGRNRRPNFRQKADGWTGPGKFREHLSPRRVSMASPIINSHELHF